MPLVIGVSRTTRLRAHIQRCWRVKLTSTHCGRRLAVQGVRTGLTTGWTPEGVAGGATVGDDVAGGVRSATVPRPDSPAEQPASSPAANSRIARRNTVMTLRRLTRC